MTLHSFSAVQSKEIFTFGKESFQIDENNLYPIKSCETFLRYLDKLPQEERIPFLNYQYEQTKYPKTFLMLIENKFTKRVFKDDGNYNEIIDWVNNQLPFEIREKQKADDFFKIPKSKLALNRELQKEWKENIKSYIEDKDLISINTFLNYGKEQLQESYSLHKLICTQAHLCKMDNAILDFIKFIEQLIETPKPLEAATNAPIAKKTYNKIQWKGTQKELAELFIVLEKKGWIGEITNEAIKQCFTNSNSIQQVLKPSQDQRTKEKTFDQVYTANYIPKFHGINENPKVHK